MPAGQTRVLWIDLFVPPNTQPGAHTGGQLKLRAEAGMQDISLGFTVTVHAFTLNSTSSMSSLYNTPSGGIFDGHRIFNFTDSRVRHRRCSPSTNTRLNPHDIVCVCVCVCMCVCVCVWGRD